MWLLLQLFVNCKHPVPISNASSALVSAIQQDLLEYTRICIVAQLMISLFLLIVHTLSLIFAIR